MKHNFIISFFKIIFSNNKLYFKLYNVKFLFLHLVLRKTFTDHAFRRFSFIYYCFILFLYTYFYIDFRQFLFNFSDITSLITSIICVILCYYLLMQKTQRKIKGFYNKFFTFLSYACSYCYFIIFKEKKILYSRRLFIFYWRNNNLAL